MIGRRVKTMIEQDTTDIEARIRDLGLDFTPRPELPPSRLQHLNETREAKRVRLHQLRRALHDLVTLQLGLERQITAAEADHAIAERAYQREYERASKRDARITRAR
jgi:hypothetical protein